MIYCHLFVSYLSMSINIFLNRCIELLNYLKLVYSLWIQFFGTLSISSSARFSNNLCTLV